MAACMSSPPKEAGSLQAVGERVTAAQDLTRNGGKYRSCSPSPRRSRVPHIAWPRHCFTSHMAHTGRFPGHGLAKDGLSPGTPETKPRSGPPEATHEQEGRVGETVGDVFMTWLVSRGLLRLCTRY